MRRFNPDKELKKIQHGNRNKILYSIILLLLIISIGSTYALYQVRYSKRIIYTKVTPFSNSDLDLAIFVNGEKRTEAPNKDEGYEFVSLICDKDYTGIVTWDEENKFLSLVQIQMPIPNKCNAYFSDIVENFDYNGTVGSDGSIQEYQIPKDGLYKLEVWGAQGGSSPLFSGCAGGLGGYSTGNISLKKDDVLYIVVGGAGTGNGTHTYQVGGYNGGGNASPDGDGNTRQSSGGGATHIATSYGLLSELDSDRDSILIVAGGGGGSGANSRVSCQINGTGGGLQGGDGPLINNIYKGFGGTQDAGGSFASPGTITDICTGSFGMGCSGIYTGGGGGYYGGGVDSASSGGGSGYLKSTLTNAKTINGINEGNGKARISYISESL